MKKFLVPTIIGFAMVASIALAQSVSPSASPSPLPDPGLLPGNPLYFLDTVFERVQLLFASGAKAKAEKSMDFAEERLSEAAALAAQGTENRPEEALDRYQEQLSKALEYALEAQNDNQNVDDVLQRIAEATVRHQEVLARVYQQVPEEAQDAIKQAMDNSAMGHETAIEAISKDHQDEARQEIDDHTQDVQDELRSFRREGVPVPSIP